MLRLLTFFTFYALRPWIRIQKTPESGSETLMFSIYFCFALLYIPSGRWLYPPRNIVLVKKVIFSIVTLLRQAFLFFSCLDLLISCPKEKPLEIWTKQSHRRRQQGFKMHEKCSVSYLDPHKEMPYGSGSRRLESLENVQFQNGSGSSTP